MVLIAVEAVPAGRSPPVAVGVRISSRKRNGFGASAPLSATASSLQRRAGGSAIMPKLVKLVGPSSTLLAEGLSPLWFARSAAAGPSVRLRVCQILRLPPWRDVVVKLYTQGLLNAYYEMPRKKSKDVPEGNGPVTQDKSGLLTMEEIRRIISEATEKYFDKWTSHYGLKPEYPKEKNINQRLAGLEYEARQPRLATEANVETDKKTRKRTEGAAAADRAKKKNPVNI